MRGVREVVVGSIVAAVISVCTAVSEAFELKPIPPPGIADIAQKLLILLYWGAVVACIGGFIGGIVSLVFFGYERGKTVAILALVALGALVVLRTFISAIIPGF